MRGQLFNTKLEGINILEEYFRKFNSNELGYYLEKSPKISVSAFINSNVYCPEDIELKNLFLNHLKIVAKKIFNLNSELNYISVLPKTHNNSQENFIKISFISNSIHLNNMFVIGNSIFIKYQYLIKIFEYIEYNEYTTMDDIYIERDKIYDMSLLKDISYSIYSILQNKNPNIWNEYISNNNKCIMVPIKNIKFKLNYKIIQEPNVDFVQGKVAVYWLGPYNIYASFNSICSKDNTFNPYWEQRIIKLEYKDGIYNETSQIDIDKYKNKTTSFINNLIPTPFENKSIQLTNSIIYNN